MISITKATANDFHIIAKIGKVAVGETHKASCSTEDLNDFLEKNYTDKAIQEELSLEKNIYHIIYFNGETAGFSKIVLDCEHPNIQQKNVTKLDRIYLLKEFFDLKLGFELLNFNIDLAKRNKQSGIWLFTWVENKRAVNFYLKAGFEITGSHNFKVTETHYNKNHQMFLQFP